MVSLVQMLTFLGTSPTLRATQPRVRAHTLPSTAGSTHHKPSTILSKHMDHTIHAPAPLTWERWPQMEAPTLSARTLEPTNHPSQGQAPSRSTGPSVKPSVLLVQSQLAITSPRGQPMDSETATSTSKSWLWRLSRVLAVPV